MLVRWKGVILSLSAATVLLASCQKKKSPDPDTPLPVTYYPSVIINSDNQIVYALDPKTGKKNWELSLPSLGGATGMEYTPSPLVYHGSVYITCTNSDTVYKINAQTGKITSKLPATPTNNFGFKATPMADGNLIYLAGLNNILYAMDTGTGNIAWSFGTSAPLVSSPIVYKGHVYIATTDGHVFSLDKTNGPNGSGYPTWEWPGRDGTGATIPSTAKFISSPAISYPYIYIGSISDSSMYCFFVDNTYESSTGSNYYNGINYWKYKTKGAIYSSPIATSGRLIFGSNDFHLYCLDTTIDVVGGRSTPQPIWIDSTFNEIVSSPCVSNQVVYVGSKDYYLYAFNIIDGRLKWQFKTNGLVKASPVAYNGLVYIASYDKYLYAVDSSSGTQKWSQNVNGSVECSAAIDDLTGKNQINSTISGFSRGWAP